MKTVPVIVRKGSQNIANVKSALVHKGMDVSMESVGQKNRLLNKINHRVITADEKLMQAYQMGDSQAFVFLYQQNAPKVFAYLKKRLQRKELAEEFFQAVFEKFHRLRHRYRPMYTVEQWLYVISRSIIIDYFRKQNREMNINKNVSIIAIPSEIKTIENNNVYKNILFEHLSAQQRQVVELKVFDELSYKEIAQRLVESESNIRQLFSRAIRKLKSIAKKEEEYL